MFLFSLKMDLSNCGQDFDSNPSCDQKWLSAAQINLLSVVTLEVKVSDKILLHHLNGQLLLYQS